MSRTSEASGIGTFQLFQETYHRETYQAVHVGGKKKDFDYRVTGMHRAMEAGIDDVGIGVLFGLADWRYEIRLADGNIRRGKAGGTLRRRGDHARFREISVSEYP